jgi:hypothetical protein
MPLGERVETGSHPTNSAPACQASGHFQPAISDGARLCMTGSVCPQIRIAAEIEN